MKPAIEQFRHWLPPLGAAVCLLLVGRMIYFGLTSPQSSLGAVAGPGAFLLVLAGGLYRRWNWARWIAAILCFLMGVFCFVFLVSRFSPPGIFGTADAPAVERPSLAVTFVLLLPPSVLLPIIAHLLRPPPKQPDTPG